MLRSPLVRFVALLVMASCKGHPRANAVDAAASASVPSAVVTATPAPRALDAGRVEVTPPVFFDAGASACRVVYGRAPQVFTGPAALVATDTGIEVIAHKNGLIRVESFPAEPLKTAKTNAGRALEGAPQNGSRPACAASGALTYCSDAKGNVHRALRAQASDEIVAHADLGAHVAAANLAGHALIGFLAARTTTEGRVSEAFVKLDDAAPVRISEEGSGATELVLAERGEAVVALLVDARRAMTPVHARVLRFDGKLVVDPDAVIFVGGGSEHQMSAAVATSKGGAAFALLPTSTEHGFGLVSAEIGAPPRIDEPTHVSLYPNGIDAAPIAATHGGASMYIARVRPLAAEPTSPRVLELGRLDAEGVFSSLGLISATGSVVFVNVVLDREGGLWVYYTDGAGSWLERRACP